MGPGPPRPSGPLVYATEGKGVGICLQLGLYAKKCRLLCFAVCTALSICAVKLTKVQFSSVLRRPAVRALKHLYFLVFYDVIFTSRNGRVNIERAE